MKQRLQKILSSAGIASRRAAEKLIEEGRVEVDGVVVRELGASADPDVQDVRFDGSRVRPGRPRRYVALHKPKGYVTTRSDPGRRPTVMELLPPALRSLYPVGRLDMGSTGLLILTDDGELALKLTHPRYGVEKSYIVTLAGSPDARVLAQATRGIVVEGDRLALDSVQILTARSDRNPAAAEDRSRRTRLRATLSRGKNREIRRLFEALGFPVVDLHRERIGGLSVRGIPPGGSRPLGREELELLLKGTSAPRKTGRGGGRDRSAAERAERRRRPAGRSSREGSAGAAAPKKRGRTKK